MSCIFFWKPQTGFPRFCNAVVNKTNPNHSHVFLRMHAQRMEAGFTHAFVCRSLYPLSWSFWWSLFPSWRLRDQSLWTSLLPSLRVLSLFRLAVLTSAFSPCWRLPILLADVCPFSVLTFARLAVHHRQTKGQSLSVEDEWRWECFWRWANVSKLCAYGVGISAPPTCKQGGYQWHASCDNTVTINYKNQQTTTEKDSTFSHDAPRLPARRVEQNWMHAMLQSMALLH